MAKSRNGKSGKTGKTGKTGKSGKSGKSGKASKTVSLTKPLESVSKNVDPVINVEEFEQEMKNRSPLAIFINIIIGGITIIINYMALMWILKLEEIDCKCSDSWMRYYIKYFLYLYFIVQIILLIVNIYIYANGLSPKFFMNELWLYFILFFSLFSFINIIISIIYIDQLKKLNCDCSEDIKREVYWYYNIIRVVFIIFTILLSLATVFMVSLISFK